MRLLRIILVISALLILVGCGPTTGTSPAVMYKNYSEQQLFTAGERATAKGDYAQATKYYIALDALYPFGANAQQAQANIIYAYYLNKNYSEAEAAAERYIRLYPRGSHVDYAYYMKGVSLLYQDRTFFQRVFPIDLALRDLGPEHQAFYDFRDLVELFPNSRYAPSAHQYMIYLRNLFAQHELEVGKYYFKRYAYVAASNRASYLIQHYQQTPQIEPALVLLVKSNRRLGNQQAANDALHVLQTNYPHSRALRRLMRG